MNLNPEFQRQLYLECSQSRLIGIPMVLGIIFTFSYFIDGYHLGAATAKTALTLFMLISFLWGARQAIDSVIEEYRERTWDIQRLSALGPWDMVWGKLLGSTSMVWYGGAICLAVYLQASTATDRLAIQLFYSICTAMLIQSISLLLGTLAAQRDQLKSGSVLLLAVVAFIFLSPWLMESSVEPYFSGPRETLSWYGFICDAGQFHRISLLLALAWSYIGNYRLMAVELGVRTLPWLWLAFTLYLIVYLGGFIPADTYSFSLASFAVCVTLTYVGVVVERNDAMRIKRLFTYALQRHWRRAGEELPIWWPTLLLAIPTALVLNFSENLLSQLGAHFHFYPLSVALIMVRDCGIYLYFCYGKNPQRAFNLTLLTGALIYAIVPGIFNLLGQNSLAAWFFPLWAESAGGALLAAGLQCALILNLLYRRWQLATGA